MRILRSVERVGRCKCVKRDKKEEPTPDRVLRRIRGRRRPMINTCDAFLSFPGSCKAKCRNAICRACSAI